MGIQKLGSQPRTGGTAQDAINRRLQRKIDQLIAMLEAAGIGISSLFWEMDGSGDLMPGVSPAGVAAWELDANGDIMPSNSILEDVYWEDDASGDIMPKVA